MSSVSLNLGSNNYPLTLGTTEYPLTLGTTEYPLTVVDGTALTLSLSGPAGPTGAAGAAGPNTVSTSTSTNLTGYIYGNGTTVGGATAATSAATANTLVLRNASGGVAVSTINNLAITAAANSTLTIDEDKGITLFDSITTEFGGYINTDVGGYIVTGVNGNITTSAGGYIQTGIGGHISTAAGGSFATGTGNLTGPNASGTVPVYTGTPATGQVLTASGTAGLTNWTSATPAGTANTLVLRDAEGGGVSFQGESGTAATIQSTSGRGAFITSQTATGAEIFSNTGTGADILSGSGTGARIESLSGTGANIIGSSGTYHAQFGNSGINQSFIARVKGALGWIRGAYTGRIHPPDTLTADRTYTLPNASGTVALIDPSSGTQTFSGAQIFDSTTRPTSSGTGTPASNSLVTRADLALEALEQLPVPLNWGGTAGTANSSGSNFGSSLILSVLGSAAVVGNFRESQHALGSPMNRNGSGANNPFLASRFSTLFEFTSNGIVSGSNEIRFLFGVGNVQTLSAAGLGLVINSNTTVKLQIHNGTSLEESANITIPQINYICRMFLSWDGAKIVFGFANSFAGVIPRMTKIAEFSHSSAIPSLCGGASWKIVNIATGITAFQHTLYLRSAHYTPYVIALP